LNNNRDNLVAQGKYLLSGGSQIIGSWDNARYQGRTAGRNMAGGSKFFLGNIPHNITNFMRMDFVSIGEVKGQDRMEKKYDGKRYIQLFQRGRLLTGAITKKDRTGAVVVNKELCIGCHSCALACPFGVPRYDLDEKMRKCHLCIEEWKSGWSLLVYAYAP
jgi:NAD-dependent dihydropyrimidine dehydrogenase PreA subunit